MTPVERLIILDPGLADTGFLATEGKRIVRAETWRTKGSASRDSFEATMRRVFEQADALSSALFDLKPSRVVMEGYRDFGGMHKRDVKLRWTTPLVIAAFSSVCQHEGVSVTWQDPAVVMGAYSAHMLAHKAGGRGIYPGDSLVTTEHERSAMAHLLAYNDRQRYGRRAS